jgi:hypothetical protein
MGIMDARGRVRPGVFEKVYDEETGTTFTPVSGTGATMYLKAEGPNVNAQNNIVRMGKPPALTMADILRMKASMQGVVNPPMSDLIVMAPRPRRK